MDACSIIKAAVACGKMHVLVTVPVDTAQVRERKHNVCKEQLVRQLILGLIV